MTDNEYGIYILLCMTGRVEEALVYRALCEAREQKND